MTDAATDPALAAARLTLADILRSQAIIRPMAPALVAGETVLGYRELDRLSDRIASGLIARGLRRGDRIAVMSRNSLPFALLYHAAAKAGMAVAALNWRNPAEELARAIRLTEPAALAYSGDFAGAAAAIGGDRLRLCLDGTAGGPALDDLAAAPPAAIPAPEPEDLLSVVFTSGTTGTPKAVGISQRALIARAAVMGVDWSPEPGDAFVGWAPMFHISASDYLFTTVVLGGTYVVEDGFDAGRIAAIVRRRRIGWLFLVPGTFEPMVEALRADPPPPGQVKIVGVMADLIPPPVLEDLVRLTGAAFLNSFGMTETGLLPCAPSFLRSKDETSASLPKRQSALCRVKLADEAGNEVPDGEAGELWVRSQTLASGYWNDPAATAAAFAGGWYHSGDVMRRLPDGTLQFVGRLSGMMKSGGENIYPAEIERALLTHPAVAEAAALGVPHPRWGEAPHAFVALRDGQAATPEALKLWLRDRIAAYKIPQEIHVIGLEDFPRNVTGKIDRRRLAQQRPAAG